MTQSDNDTSCSIMYKIRDQLNCDNIGAAIMLARELVVKLEAIAMKKHTIDCVLDCSTNA